MCIRDRDNIMYKLLQGEWKVVLSPAMLACVTQQLHIKMAHASPVKCVKILQEDFTITNMYRRVRRLLKTCLPCQTAKAPNLHTYVPMANVITEGKGQMFATDFLGPLPKATRNLKHIVVCVDVFTKKVSLYAIPRPTTKSVLNIILNRYIPQHGPIKSVLSDQGKQFQNKHWAATLERNGIKAVSYTHLDVYKRQVYS